MDGDTPGLERRFSAAGARAHSPRTDGNVTVMFLFTDVYVVCHCSDDSGDSGDQAVAGAEQEGERAAAGSGVATLQVL
jgi:hypothetical protein